MGIFLKIKKEFLRGIPYMGNSSEPCLTIVISIGRKNVFSGILNGNHDFS
jgi:hypothetical protein